MPLTNSDHYLLASQSRSISTLARSPRANNILSIIIMASANTAKTLLNRSRQILGVSLDEYGVANPSTSTACMDKCPYPVQMRI